MITVVVHAFLAWLISALYFMRFSGLPRALFATFHYVVVVASSLLVFGLYFKYNKSLSPFTVMAIAMATIFITELIVFNFIYKGDLWFLNFQDYIFPIFLTASAIYFVGKFIQ